MAKTKQLTVWGYIPKYKTVGEKKKKPRNDHRNQQSEMIFKAMLLFLSALLKYR